MQFTYSLITFLSTVWTPTLSSYSPTVNWTKSDISAPGDITVHNGFYSDYDHKIYVLGDANPMVFDLESQTWAWDERLSSTNQYSKLNAQWGAVVDNVYYFYDNGGHITRFDPITPSHQTGFAFIGYGRKQCVTSNGVDTLYILDYKWREGQSFMKLNVTIDSPTVEYGPELPYLVSTCQLAYYQGTIYVFGGDISAAIWKIQVGENNVNFDNAIIEDIPYVTMPGNRLNMANAVVAGNGLIYITGFGTAHVYSFDPENEAGGLTTETSLSKSRRHAPFVWSPYDNRLYVLGGAYGMDYSNQLYPGSYDCDALDCDDGDLCTVDSCGSATGCTHTAKCAKEEQTCNANTGDCYVPPDQMWILGTGSDPCSDVCSDYNPLYTCDLSRQVTMTEEQCGKIWNSSLPGWDVDINARSSDFTLYPEAAATAWDDTSGGGTPCQLQRNGKVLRYVRNKDNGQLLFCSARAGWGYGLCSCKTGEIATTASLTTTTTATTAECDEAASFVWEDLMTSELGKPNAVTTLAINQATLSLNITVEADYLGKSQADDNGFVYGTTYVIDFDDFNAHSDNIKEAGNCENREDIASDTTWQNVWKYSDTPNTDGHIGSNDYLAYPPGNQWSLAMSDDEPCTVIYSASFTWNQLAQCTNYDESAGSYITTKDNENNITLSGTLYINVVSPYDYAADYGFYRVYQLVSEPFMIVVSKTTYVLGEVGINLLTIDIIGVYKEGEENTFRLIVLTESAEYLQLSRDDLAETTNLFDVFVPSETNLITSADFRMLKPAETGSDCLGNKQYICTQLWQITADNVQCTSGGIFTDFSGTYSIQFSPQCRSAADLGGDTALNSYCIDWLADHFDEITDSTANNAVLLSATLSWKDEICDPEIFSVQFSASMQFYTDADYLNEVVDPSTGHLFQVGEDAIYVRVTTDYPQNTFSVFDTELLNVWICTFDPLVTPDSITIDSQTGGCFDGDRDDNSDNFIEHIYDFDGGVALEGFVLDTTTTTLESNEIQFKLIVPDKVARDTLYIHAQIEVSLGETRRRMIIETETEVVQKHANQMEHFVDKVGIKSVPQAPDNVIPYEPPVPVLPSPNTWLISLQSPWVIAIICVAALFLTINAMFMCYANCLKPNRTTRYAPIKAVDSSDFSENDALNIDVSN